MARIPQAVGVQMLCPAMPILQVEKYLRGVHSALVGWFSLGNVGSTLSYQAFRVGITLTDRCPVSFSEQGMILTQFEPCLLMR